MKAITRRRTVVYIILNKENKLYLRKSNQTLNIIKYINTNIKKNVNSTVEQSLVFKFVSKGLSSELQEVFLSCKNYNY